MREKYFTHIPGLNPTVLLQILRPKRKQTKRVLTKNFYSPQSKISIFLEVGIETKLFPDSLLGNFVMDTRQNQKQTPLFLSLPCFWKLSYLPGGDPS
jgi:hypothetical protein